MKFPRRQNTDTVESEAPVEPVETDPRTPAAKGRPTPKRRDSGPKRGPVGKAPTTRREAMKWQKERAKAGKQSAATGPTLTAAERRERMLAGDERYLMKRDVGAVRGLTRDYVDSHRMLSNFLLPVLFLALILPVVIRTKVSYLSNVVLLALVLVFAVEWYLTGKRIIALAAERGLEAGRDKPFGLGFYAGQRAYMPRRMRQPRPRRNIGDPL